VHIPNPALDRPETLARPRAKPLKETPRRKLIRAQSAAAHEYGSDTGRVRGNGGGVLDSGGTNMPDFGVQAAAGADDLRAEPAQP